jgi:hypothetical protein
MGSNSPQGSGPFSFENGDGRLRIVSKEPRSDSFVFSSSYAEKEVENEASVYSSCETEGELRKIQIVTVLTMGCGGDWLESESSRVDSLESSKDRFPIENE